MARKGPNEIAAAGMGIEHDTLRLWRIGPKEWANGSEGAPTRVEWAALDHFKKQGWLGYAGEGGLILNLIKAASFAEIPMARRGTFIEAIYSVDRLLEDWEWIPISKQKMLDSIESSSAE